MNENLILLIINIAGITIIGISFCILPLITRKSFLFGVRVSPENQKDKDAVKLKRNYVVVVSIVTLVLVALADLQYFFVPELTIVTTTLTLPLVFRVFYYILYIICWKKALKLKKDKNWQVPDVIYAPIGRSRVRGSISSVPWIWYIICFLIILISGLYLFGIYDTLPDTIATHFDIYGVADAFAAKSYYSVFMMHGIAFILLLVLIFVGVTIAIAKYQIDNTNPAKSFLQNKKYRIMLGHAVGFLSICLTISMLIPVIIMMNPNLKMGIAVTIIPTLISIISILFVKIKAGQGGGKLKIDESLLDTVTQDNTTKSSYMQNDDTNWKLGMFYYNKEDPAWIVEDRFGNNIGFNYAKKPVLIGSIVLSVFLVASLVILAISLV